MSERAALRPFREPLGMAGLELADLARLAGRLEVAIAVLASRDIGLGAELLGEFQGADFLAQRLAGMAAFMRAMAAAAPSDAVVDVLAAVQGLTLAEQARRLSGPEPASDPDWAGEGDLLLFGD